MKEFYTNKQALARVKCSQPTWWRINNSGEGPPRVKLTEQLWIYPVEAFENWLNSRLNKPINSQPAE